MKTLFVAGTDTGVGKSVVTGLLARYFREKRVKVITQKWIQTGSKNNFSQDIELHLRIMGVCKQDIKCYLSCVSPYCFKEPCSPHLAARIENKIIDANKIKKSLVALKRDFDLVIVEGSGGVLVPFSAKGLLIDLVKENNLPVLVVVANKLGAINHALLTIEALRRRRLKILGLVFCDVRNEDKFISRDNPKIVKILAKEKILGILPWERKIEKLYKKFIPIGKNIARCL